MKRAARSLGGFVMVPPIEKGRAETILGQTLPNEAWIQIKAAFRRYGDALDDLRASKSSLKKDDAQSWHARQTAVVKSLETALSSVQAAQDPKHGAFLWEASHAYSSANWRDLNGNTVHADNLLSEAYRLILNAMVIVERAEPEDISTPSRAEARDTLVRAIRSALEGAEIAVSIPSGWRLSSDATVTVKDLPPFAQLIAEMGIDEADLRKPRHLLEWLRRL